MGQRLQDARLAQQLDLLVRARHLDRGAPRQDDVHALVDGSVASVLSSRSIV